MTEPVEMLDTKPPIARLLGEELLLAFSLLTRFPLPRIELRTKATLSSAIWAYPLVGGIVGAVGGAVFFALATLGLSPLAAIICAMAAMALATGGFHEDGLADFWDGLGGGQSRERKLEIMRDSRIGTYGLLALVFVLALQAASLDQISGRHSLAQVAIIFVAVGALARAAIMLPLWTLQPARDEGMSVAASRPPLVRCAFAVASAATIAFAGLGLLPALSAIAAAILGAAAIATLAARYLGGYTGDVLGATAMTAATCALLSCAIALASTGATP